MNRILYRVTNKVNGKIYVGVHKTPNLDDGYMGSGKVIQAAFKKHGLENFEREILETFETDAAMFAREAEVVNEEFLARPDVYNLRRGGHGGFDFINSKSDIRIPKNQKARKSADKTLLEKYGEDFRHQLGVMGHAAAKESPNWNPGFRSSEHQQMGNSPQARVKAAVTLKETIAKKGLHRGSKNSQYGSFWITDGVSNKKSRGEIPDGWRRGRKCCSLR